VESGLTSPPEIIELARSRSPEVREKLLTAVAELCDRQEQPCLAPEAQSLLQQIFMGLVLQAERDIRQRLAERLASATWAPPALISVLALDDIDIARPVIARSPLLKDHDLVHLLVESTLEHQIEVARRPAIGPPVVNAILDQGLPPVLIALAGNETAEVSALAMSRLVAASQRIAGLRGALAQHPRLTQELAVALYGWVGEALRASVVARFDIDTTLLEKSLSEAIVDAVADTPGQSRMDADREREAMERRLVAKLNAADQLRPSFLLRSLREGRLVRFEEGLTALGGFPPASIRRAMDGTRPEALALACAAVGIDRSVFPTILSLVRALNQGRPASTPESTHLINEAFAISPPDAAEMARRSLGAN